MVLEYAFIKLCCYFVHMHDVRTLKLSTETFSVELKGFEKKFLMFRYSVRFQEILLYSLIYT